MKKVFAWNNYHAKEEFDVKITHVAIMNLHWAVFSTTDRLTNRPGVRLTD